MGLIKKIWKNVRFVFNIFCRFVPVLMYVQCHDVFTEAKLQNTNSQTLANQYKSYVSFSVEVFINDITCCHFCFRTLVCWTFCTLTIDALMEQLFTLCQTFILPVTDILLYIGLMMYLMWDPARLQNDAKSVVRLYNYGSGDGWWVHTNTIYKLALRLNIIIQLTKWLSLPPSRDPLTGQPVDYPWPSIFRLRCNQ